MTPSPTPRASLPQSAPNIIHNIYPIFQLFLDSRRRDRRQGHLFLPSVHGEAGLCGAVRKYRVWIQGYDPIRHSGHARRFGGTRLCVVIFTLVACSGEPCHPAPGLPSKAGTGVAVRGRSHAGRSSNDHAEAVYVKFGPATNTKIPQGDGY